MPKSTKKGGQIIKCVFPAKELQDPLAIKMSNNNMFPIIMNVINSDKRSHYTLYPPLLLIRKSTSENCSEPKYPCEAPHPAYCCLS